MRIAGKRGRRNENVDQHVNACSEISYRIALYWMRTLLTGLREWQWLAPLIARLAVGPLFFLSGRGKLFVPERREQMRETLAAAGIPFAGINAIFVSMVELVFGVLLILGALTRLACIMLGGVMIVAIATSAVKDIKRRYYSVGSQNFCTSERRSMSKRKIRKHRDYNSRSCDIVLRCKHLKSPLI